MATALRPIGHEDRLSLVEHLDELRSRLIVCVVAFVAAFGSATGRTTRSCDIVNKPLERREGAAPTAASTPATRSSRAARSPDCSRQASRRRRGPASRSGATTLASVTLAARPRSCAPSAAPTARGARPRRGGAPTDTNASPVTLGVAEPFTHDVHGRAVRGAAAGAAVPALPALRVRPAGVHAGASGRVALPMMAMVPVLFIAGCLRLLRRADRGRSTSCRTSTTTTSTSCCRPRTTTGSSILFLGAIGLLFQIPVGVLAVTRLGIVSTKQLRKNRGYAFLASRCLPRSRRRRPIR